MRRHAQVKIKVISKEGKVGKVERIGNLLNGQIGGFQLRLCIHDHHLGNDIGNRFTRFLFNDHAEVLGRYTQTTGVKGRMTLRGIVFHRQLDEPFTNLLAPAFVLSRPFMSTIKVAYAVNNGNKHLLDRFGSHLRRM